MSGRKGKKFDSQKIFIIYQEVQCKKCHSEEPKTKRNRNVKINDKIYAAVLGCSIYYFSDKALLLEIIKKNWNIIEPNIVLITSIFALSFFLVSFQRIVKKNF